MSESLNVAALAATLSQLDPAFSDADALEVEPFSGGASNLTALVRCGERRVVVRRAPPGKKAATAHDMVREARVMRAIRPHFPLVPEVLAVGEDPEILGTPFFVMEYLDGQVPNRKLPQRVSEPQARTLCRRLVDLHADIHQIDLEATGLIDLGKPEGYVRRQIEGWTRRYRDARTEDVATCEGIIEWLHANMPAEVGAALIHNDFKFDNLVLAHDDPTRIIGVLDWEMATVGDPLMDLGASLAYWVDRDDPPPLHAMRTQPTTVPGMMTRAEVVAHYGRRTGRALGDLTYYYVYGLFRLAGIAQQIYARYVLGQSTNPRFASFGMAVNVLAAHAEMVIRRAEG